MRRSGSSEALASGPRHDVDAFIAKCMKGPPSARVKSVDLAPADPPDRLGFTRRPTM
jgi:acylphosphatase